jgi:hypothetical protein
MAPLSAPARDFIGRFVGVVFLCGLLLVVPGCSIFGWVAQIAQNEEPTVEVEARYKDLAGQEVAVLVAGDQRTLLHYPKAREGVCKLISQRLAENVEDIELMDPEAVIDYQVNHPYWHTLRYSTVIDRLEVDRLVIVDLVDFRTREPGNRHVQQGQATANVGVVEAEAEDPDNFAFHAVVEAEYPDNTNIGVVNAEGESIQLGLIKTFSERAAGLFYKHQEAP